MKDALCPSISNPSLLDEIEDNEMKLLDINKLAEIEEKKQIEPPAAIKKKQTEEKVLNKLNFETKNNNVKEELGANAEINDIKLEFDENNIPRTDLSPIKPVCMNPDILVDSASNNSKNTEYLFRKNDFLDARENSSNEIINAIPKNKKYADNQNIEISSFICLFSRRGEFKIKENL